MADDAPAAITAPCFNQETDPVVYELEFTRTAVKQAYKDFSSWRTFGKFYNLPHHVLWNIAERKWSHVSWETVRLVRARLNLPDPGPLMQTLACPTCGAVHVAGDCHGAPIAAVVILQPGERVQRPAPARARRRYHRPCMDDATFALWLEFKAQHG